jgi:hypothetical protein
MNGQNTNFFNSQVSFGRKPTRITPGLGVRGEVLSEHLHQAFGIDQPHNINMGYARVFSATDRYHDKPIVGMTEAKGNIKLLTNHIYRWRLSGDMHQKLRVTQRICTDPRPGLNQQPFEIVLDKPWFQLPDVIQGEDNRYRLRVMDEEPVEVGVNEYKYTVQLMTDNPAEFFPPELIEENMEFCKVSSAVANESNQDFGGFQFATIFESEGQLGQFAVKFELSDRAARKAKQCADEGKYGDEYYGKYVNQLRVPFMSTDEKGNPVKWTNFMSMAEAEMHNRIYSDVEDALVLGRKSSYIKSREGFTVTTGSGLREQLESGNILQHNGNMTLSQLNDWFTAILKDKRNRGDAKIILSCGIKFAEMFDAMVKADSSTFLTLDTHFIRKGSDYHHMDYGAYFASYKGFIVEVQVMLNPSYDNRYFQPKMHPVYPNYTIDSWRADILDFGNTKQQGTGMSDPNISMVKENYCDYEISHRGKWDPKSGLPITDGGYGLAGGISGYTLIKEKSAGLMIADVSRCGAIYLNID